LLLTSDIKRLKLMSDIDTNGARSISTDLLYSLTKPLPRYSGWLEMIPARCALSIHPLVLLRE
jgi:hypothetical protein